MNVEMKNYNIQVFMDSCKQAGYKADDVRWEDNELLCTVYTSYFGVLENVRVLLNKDKFKLQYKGEKIAQFYRLPKEYSDMEDEFYNSFKSHTNNYVYMRANEKTLRKTRYNK